MEWKDVAIHGMDLFFDNFRYLLFLVFMILYRNSLGNFLSRITTFSFKDKNREVNVLAHHVKDEKEKDLKTIIQKSSLPKKEESEENKEANKISSGGNDPLGFRKVMSSFKEGTIDEIKSEYEKYATNEKDSDKLAKNKHVYLYFLFAEKQYNQGIKELESLVEAHDKEEIKFNACQWLDLAYKDLSKNDLRIKLWKKAIISFTNSLIKTKSIINLAEALNKDKSSPEARNILTDRLNELNTEEEKALIFKSLFQIEESLGNNELAFYCKDKSLEYDMTNLDELFDTAYKASEENKERLEYLSIINYRRLLDLNPKHDGGLNNFGVKASEKGLNIVAVKNYEKAEKEKNTLAMANRANLLLNAGFVNEAKIIANKALEFDNPHKNIYTLLSTIESLEEEETKKWEKIQQQAEAFQNYVRKYVSAYYLKSSNELSGSWKSINALTDIQIVISDDILKTSWIKTINNIDYTHTLKGIFTNSSFEGLYKVSSEKEETSLALLALNKNKSISVLGYYQKNNRTLFIFENDYTSSFSLTLIRMDS